MKRRHFDKLFCNKIRSMSPHYSSLWKIVYKLALSSCLFLIVLPGSKVYCHAAQSNSTTKRVRQREFLRGGNAAAVKSTWSPTITTEVTSVKTISDYNISEADMQKEKEVPWKPPVIVSANGNHTRSVIFLHGVGDTGSAWGYSIAYCRPPGTKIICPTAKELTVDFIVVTKTNSWFTKSKEAGCYENEEDMKNTTEFIHSLIDKEIENGIDPQKIILGGFSQGATVAIQAAITYPKKLGGIIALSGWLPISKKFFKNFNRVQRNISIFVGHGDQDRSVSWDLGNFTASTLGMVTNDLVFKTYHGFGHTVPDGGMLDIREFLKNQTIIHP